MFGEDSTIWVAWSKRYSALKEAVRNFANSGTVIDPNMLESIVSLMEELLQFKAAKSPFEDEMDYHFNDIKKLIDSFLKQEVNSPALFESQSKLFFLYAQLHHNINQSPKVLPILREVEAYCQDVLEKNELLSSTYSLTLAEIAKNIEAQGNSEEASKIRSKASNLFNKLDKKDKHMLKSEIEQIFATLKKNFQTRNMPEIKKDLERIKLLIGELEKILNKGDDFLNNIYHISAQLAASVGHFSDSKRYYNRLLVYYSNQVKEYLPRADQIDLALQMNRPTMSFAGYDVVSDPKSIQEKEKRWKKQMVDLEKRRVLADPRCTFCSLSLELAEFLYLQSDLEEVEFVLSRAIERYNEVFSKYPAIQPIYAGFCLLLGEIKMIQKQTEDAIKLMEEGWQKFKESYVFSDNSIFILFRALTFAKILGSIEKYKKSEEVLDELLDFLTDEKEGKKLQSVLIKIEVYLTAGITKSKLDKDKEAIEVLLTGLEIAESILSLKDFELNSETKEHIKNIIELLSDLSKNINYKHSKEIVERIKTVKRNLN